LIRPSEQCAARIDRRAAASRFPTTRGTRQTGRRVARRLGAEAAVEEPAPFVAVTMTTRLLPRSSRSTVWVSSPSMSVHDPARQRSQRYEYVNGSVPAHSPSSTLSSTPRYGASTIIGGLTLSGGDGETLHVSYGSAD